MSASAAKRNMPHKAIFYGLKNKQLNIKNEESSKTKHFRLSYL